MSSCPRLLGVALAPAFILALAAPAWSMPHNARQSAEGYWVGGLPETDDIDALHAAGVRLVISSVELPEAARQRCAELGMTQVTLRLGSTLRRPQAFVEAAEGFRADEIYIHCDHGGDRAGAVLALLLVANDGWEPDHAVLAVAYPSRANIDAVVRLLEAAGIEVTEAERERYAGIYSGRANGGTGGLKASGNARYVNLVWTTIQAFERVGVPLDVPDEPPVELVEALVPPEPETAEKEPTPPQVTP